MGRSPYTRACAVVNAYLTLLGDGERLTDTHALGPVPGEWLQRRAPTPVRRSAMRSGVRNEHFPTHRPSSPSAAAETRGARPGDLTTEATRAERHWRTVSAHAPGPPPRSRPPSTSTCKPPARSPSPKPTDAPASASLPCPAT